MLLSLKWLEGLLMVIKVSGKRKYLEEGESQELGDWSVLWATIPITTIVSGNIDILQNIYGSTYFFIQTNKRTQF